MRIYGNFTEHDYQMQVNGAQVATVHRKWLTVRDQLQVSVTGQVDRRVVIGAVIVIEHIEVTERQYQHWRGRAIIRLNVQSAARNF
jgi:uncharacterized protein YxjI